MVSVSGKVGPRTTPPLGSTRYRDNLLQDQALSLDDNSLSANLGWRRFSNSSSLTNRLLRESVDEAMGG